MKFRVFGIDIYEINIDWKLATVIGSVILLFNIINKIL